MVLLFALFGVLATAQQDGEKTLKMAWYLDHHTFGPPFHVSTADWPNYLNIYDHLVRFVPGTAELEPGLAERWEVSDDGLTYTFHLRQGVQFHNDFGEFTSEDVKFVFENLQTPEIGENYAPLAREINEIEIVDRYTVRFHMHNPFSDFLHTVVAHPAMIYSKRAFEELGPEGMQDTPAGTGAYTLEEWIPGEKMVFRANPDHFRGKPAIDVVEVYVIPEETVTVLSMQRGEIDYAFLRTPEAIRLALASPDLVVTATPVLGTRSMWLNRNQEPFGDVRVRQALAHAIDRETLVSTVLQGLATTDKMWSAIPDGIFGHTDDVATYEYDLEKARQLLAEAGYPDGFDTTLQYRVSDRAVVQAVQAMWAEIGVNAELVELDRAQFYEATQQGNWYTSISGPTRTAPDAFLAFYHSANAPNYYGEIDALIEAQRSETDPQKRQEILVQIQQQISQDLPNVPIFRPLYITVARSNVSGDVPNSHYWLWYWQEMDIE